MNIVIILGTSLIVFVGIRLFLIFLYWILKKIFKASADSEKFDLVMSIAFCLIYIQTFLGVVSGVIKNNELSNAEWYFVYTFIGISLMLWCYFSWDLKLKAKPQFATHEIQMIVKKIIVFFVVMIFSFYQGYTQLTVKFGGNLEEEKELLVTLTNITIVPGIIALDRVLSQISNYLKKKREENS
jgi:hypothetical protein